MTKTPISRRRVIKGAAWSLPVIAAAVAAPLAAASSTPSDGCLRFIGTNFTKKSLKFKVQNQCETPVTSVEVLITWDGGSLAVPLGDIVPHAHAPIEHDREYTDVIPEAVTMVTLTILPGNTTITLER